MKKMRTRTWKTMITICLSIFFFGIAPKLTYAAVSVGGEVEALTTSSYLVKLNVPTARLYAADNERSASVAEVTGSTAYEVLSYSDGWARIDTGSTIGYLPLAGQATVIETTREKVDETIALRQDVVQYALQFVGNRYVYGGSDPHTGVDCSGFTAYVMRHVAGVSLSHSSAAQAGEGRTVKSGNPKPGDLIFYSGGGRINHVAIYIGSGQIVHASSAKTGIKVSKWNGRTPARIVDVLS
ncbi:MAG: C40 family peptidase [Hungatella sp.]